MHRAICIAMHAVGLPIGLKTCLMRQRGEPVLECGATGHMSQSGWYVSVQISVVISQASAEGTNIHHVLQEAADSNRAALEKQLNDKSADLRQSEDRLVASVEDIKALEQEVLILTERISRYDGVCGQLQGLQTSLKDTQVSPYPDASGNAGISVRLYQ